MNISKFDLAAGVAAALVTALALFFSRTRIGRALRAVADDHQAALAVGIPLQQIWGIVWGVAGFVALVAGLLWGARNGVQFALTFVALKALPVLILGGFESIPGAIVGGLIIGATEKIAEVYFGPLVGGGIEGWFPYVLALVFLLVRPEGLFGEKNHPAHLNLSHATQVHGTQAPSCSIANQASSRRPMRRTPPSFPSGRTGSGWRSCSCWPLWWCRSWPPPTSSRRSSSRS